MFSELKVIIQCILLMKSVTLSQVEYLNSIHIQTKIYSVFVCPHLLPSAIYSKLK